MIPPATCTTPVAGPSNASVAMAETRNRYDLDDVVRRLRRQGPEGITAAMLAGQLGAPQTSITNLLKRNERLAKRPDGLFCRVPGTRPPKLRWTLADNGG